jgi:hypothetical protein
MQSLRSRLQGTRRLDAPDNMPDDAYLNTYEYNPIAALVS